MKHTRIQSSRKEKEKKSRRHFSLFPQFPSGSLREDLQNQQGNRPNLMPNSPLQNGMIDPPMTECVGRSREGKSDPLNVKNASLSNPQSTCQKRVSNLVLHQDEREDAFSDYLIRSFWKAWATFVGTVVLVFYIPCVHTTMTWVWCSLPKPTRHGTSSLELLRPVGDGSEKEMEIPII